ncbi:carboxypeptidase-like regulatory domain-containing protein, partial [Streptomyces sp. WAC04114]|uniref:carboxypeptidase-like regulatory domain-containing protein n=1 Tax=Streptomyces sp. WAC04114 TaxID=2867961 RepID=UPI001C8CE902
GSINLSLKAAAAAAKTHAFTSNVRVSVKSACRAERLARTLAISLPDWLRVRADKCDRLEQQAKARAEKAKKAAGIVPKGRDAWEPGTHNLKGRDWLTGRGAGPQAPPALRAPPGSTAVTGHVLKLDGKPLPKVSVRVGAKSTKTDSRGRFLLSGISAEATTLVVDGASAKTAKRSYGRYDIRIRPVAGRSTDLGFP